MQIGKHTKRRIRILVKAFPQPSQKYEETVCCAGVTEDTGELVRLYPIRFRRLPENHRFDRFDLVEMNVEKASDPRPESYHVAEESIRLIEKGRGLSEKSKVRLWAPFIAPSIEQLHIDNQEYGRSLGIVKPDIDSLKFKIEPQTKSDESDKEVTDLLFKQQSLLEPPLRRLPRPKYGFKYQYTYDGHSHNLQIHDWEVQAAFHNYKKQYGSVKNALEMMSQAYQDNIPTNNLHFIMGTMQKRPSTFILIGLLRSQLDPKDIRKQQSLI